jgi:hypothetical protein
LRKVHVFDLDPADLHAPGLCHVIDDLVKVDVELVTLEAA